MNKEINITELITKDKFIKILEEYYSVKMHRDVHFSFDVNMKYTDTNIIPEIKVYFESYIMGDKIKILAYDEEIKEALDAYTHVMIQNCFHINSVAALEELDTIAMKTYQSLKV